MRKNKEKKSHLFSSLFTEMLRWTAIIFKPVTWISLLIPLWFYNAVTDCHSPKYKLVLLKGMAVMLPDNLESE